MIFEAKNITKSYGDRLILNGINVSFSKDEIVGILGPNGAGKTTLFSILTGITRADTGEIKLDTKEITRLKVYERARVGIVYLPQDSSIFRGLNVENNVRAVLQIKHKRKEHIENRLEELLDAFSITHLRKARANSLSGGERRKVEIARAIAADPVFLMLDEPFSGIDPISISEITNIIRSLKAAGIGIIITDHNVMETLRILDKGYIIANGKIIVSGTAQDILDHEESRKIYLGETFRI